MTNFPRWGRNYLEVGDFLEQKFPAWGTRFISINDVYDSAKLNGATGGIDIAFRNLIYEMYSQDLSEKVRSGKATLAKQGKHIGGYGFFGYNKDPNDRYKLIIDPESAATVKRIYELAAQGKTLNEIARQLNTEGRTTAQQTKVKQGSKMQWTNGEANFWYGSMVSNILRDERYTGKLITGRHRVSEVGSQNFVAVPKEEWIVVDGAIPVIITQAEYDEVRSKMSSRFVPANKPSKSKLLFSRKLRCAYCGLSLKAVRRTHDVKYHCDTAGYTGDYGCQKDWIAECDVKKAVLAALQQQIAFADEARNKLQAKADRLAPSIEKMKNDLARLQRQIEKSKTTKLDLWEKYDSGAISAEGFQRENEKADEQVKSCEGKIAELERRILEMEISTGQENTFVERFSKQVGISELTRPIIEELISGIKVYSSERIEIIFNYADEYAKIAGLINDKKTKRRAS